MQTQTRQIIYTSPPTSVSMTDCWFDVASLDHFWVQRRFAVLQKFAGSVIARATRIAEIGCGNGLVQRAIEDRYGVSVAGFDLTEHALQKNVSRSSQLYCYDIHQRAPEFRAAFDVVLLMDVLEHIDDEAPFLESVKYHMAPGASLIVNVPAFQLFYSDYDRAAGHYRRYSSGSLRRVLERNQLRVCSYSYWGAPLIPLLLARKALVKLHRTEKGVISRGFDPGSRAANSLLGTLSRCEAIPQGIVGTSLMAVAEVS